MPIHVEIRNWEKYNPRSDVKSTQWFRLQNDLLIELFELTNDQKLVWIALLCEASRKQSGKIDVSPSLIAALLKISEDDVLLALDLFENLERISSTSRARDEDVTHTLRERDADVPLRDGTGRDGTGQEHTSCASPPSAEEDAPDRFSPSDLASLWNTHRGPLAAVRGMTGKRRPKAAARIKENADQAYWVDVVSRLAKSPLATGQVKSEKFPKGWRADFDWLIANDTNHVKVAEGRFDDRGKPTGAGKSLYETYGVKLGGGGDDDARK